MKKIITAALCILMITAALTGCQKVVSTGTTTSAPKATESVKATESEAETVSFEPKSTEALISFDDVPEQDLSKVDADYQYAEPVDGEEIAIIHTNYGDICIKFFPEAAPMAVTNFKALAKAGRYDETIIHRIFHVATSGIDGIQGGDYTNFNGTGGESAFGESFGYEISEYLSNIAGSVAMAHSSLPDSNGSQFYINSADNTQLDGNYTVFAQVYDGMDVVEMIAESETVGETPVNQIIVESIEITEF